MSERIIASEAPLCKRAFPFCTLNFTITFNAVKIMSATKTNIYKVISLLGKESNRLARDVAFCFGQLSCEDWFTALARILGAETIEEIRGATVKAGATVEKIVFGLEFESGN